MEHARAPDPLPGTGNMANNWKAWKEDFIIFMKLTGYIERSNDFKGNLFKNRIGKIGLDAINKFVFDNPEDKDNMDILIQKLDLLFDPPKKETEERYKFFTRSRKGKERIEDYIEDLKEKAKTCNFGDLTESLIRDVIIVDTKDKVLRTKYLNEENLTLSKIVEITKQYESSTEHLKNTEEKTLQPKQKNNCWRCRKTHALRNCPAWNTKCEHCGEMHHFPTCCPKFLAQQKSRDEAKGKEKRNNAQAQKNDKLKGAEANYYNLPSGSTNRNQTNSNVQWNNTQPNFMPPNSNFYNNPANAPYPLMNQMYMPPQMSVPSMPPPLMPSPPMPVPSASVPPPYTKYPSDFEMVEHRSQTPTNQNQTPTNQNQKPTNQNQKPIQHKPNEQKKPTFTKKKYAPKNQNDDCVIS